MAVFDALSDTVSLIRDEPGVAGIAGLAGIISTVLGSGEMLGLPSAATTLLSIISFLLTPFLLAGLYGLIDEAAAGGGLSTDAAIETLSDRGPSLLGAYIIAVLGFAVVAVGIVVLALIPIVGWMLLPVAFVMLLAATIVLMFLDVTVVLGGSSAIDSFNDSLELVKQNTKSVLGYMTLRGIIGIGLGLPYAAATLSAETGELNYTLLAVGIVGSFVSTAFLHVYHVQYYRALPTVSPPESVDTAADLDDPEADTF